ncbi:MAG: DUF2330 domain-containing protein [Myxococcota bacterium]
MTRFAISRLTFFLVAVGSLAAPRPAAATARFFADSADVKITVDAHRILTVWRDGKATLTVQPVVSAAGGDPAGRLGYLLPVHGLPELDTADPAVFADLFALSSPSVVTERHQSGDGCESDSARRDEVFTPSVDAIAGTPSPDVTATVISPATIGAAQSWLTDEGFAFTETDIAELKAELDGGARFVGVTFPRTGATTEPAPVAVNFFEPPDIRLALALSAASTATGRAAETVIFVVADKRFRILNYGSIDISELGTGVHDQLAAGDAGSYDVVLDRATERAGGRVFVTEMARDLRTADLTVPDSVSALIDDEIAFLTRLHARVPPGSLADPVVTFAKDGPEVLPEAVVPAPGVALGLGIGLLFALGFIRRRRPATPRA